MYQHKKISKRCLKSSSSILLRNSRNKKKNKELLHLLAAQLIAYFISAEISNSLPHTNVLNKSCHTEACSNDISNISNNNPNFIELKPYPLKIPERNNCIIRMQNNTGSKMKITLNSNEPYDISNITESFWRNIK